MMIRSLSTTPCWCSAPKGYRMWCQVVFLQPLPSWRCWGILVVDVLLVCCCVDLSDERWWWWHRCYCWSRSSYLRLMQWWSPAARWWCTILVDDANFIFAVDVHAVQEGRCKACMDASCSNPCLEPIDDPSVAEVDVVIEVVQDALRCCSLGRLAFCLVNDSFELICVDVSQLYFSMSQVEDVGDGIGDDLEAKRFGRW